MDSMKSNDVWDLVDLSNRVRLIGCKWVYKTKKDSLGNIERYKTRLIAKGSLKENELITWIHFFLYRRKISFI